MPGSARPVTDERDGLLAYLAQQRLGLRATAHGLTDEQASSTPTVSSLSIAGLVKHTAWTERSWMSETVMQRDAGVPDYPDQFRLVDGETMPDVLAFYGSVAAETEAIVDELDDLEYRVPVPDAPWFPKDVEAWSLRWVLLHLIEETARHGGHADIVREAIDGRTFYENIAAYESTV
jgi:Protein of unknown function (DUF664)